jgi:putative tricarboxylic transport membrane protein
LIYFWSLLVGVFGGVIVGLLPSISPAVGFLILLPLISIDPVSIVILAITINIGAQFFGSQAVLYYRLPGETSSYPTLMEAKNFRSSHQIYQAVQVTTIGSLVATIISSLIFGVILLSGVFQNLLLPIIVKAMIYLILLMLIVFVPLNKILVNVTAFVIVIFIANYSEVSAYSQGFLPIYYINEMLSLIILFSMQLVWHRHMLTYEGAKVQTSKDFLSGWSRWKSLYLKYSALGLIGGLIPAVGATLSSYAGYLLESYKKKSEPLRKIAAAETANNSATVSSWLPLLVFGVPITATEILLLDFFQQNGMSLKSLVEFNNVTILILMIVFAGILFSIIALTTNQFFYLSVAKFLCDVRFALLIVTFGVTSLAISQSLSLSVVLTHLAIFIPLSWIMSKTTENYLLITVGFLLSNEMFFTFMQTYQIYL